MIDIGFNEEEHRYYDDKGTNFTSVTTLIGKYKPKYDQEFWSMFTALKEHNLYVKPEPLKQIIYINGIANTLKQLTKDYLYSSWQKEVLIKWEIKNKEACIRGNIIHNKLEDNINKSKNDIKGNTNSFILPTGNKVIKTQHELDATNLKEDFNFVYNRLSGYLDRGFSIFAEKRVFLMLFELFGIAGMIDCPLFYDKYFAILDWKTNEKELRDTAGYYKKIKIDGKWIKTNTWVETDEVFLEPLSHLSVSKLNEYALQLSLYAYILEQWGYILLDNGLEIIHYPITNEPKLIKVPYLKKEIQLLLGHYTNINKLDYEKSLFPNV